MKYKDPSKRLTNGSADLAKGFNTAIPDNKKAKGIIIGKYPVRLSDGKTTVYCKDKSKIEETRIKWEAIIAR